MVSFCKAGYEPNISSTHVVVPMLFFVTLLSYFISKNTRQNRWTIAPVDKSMPIKVHTWHANKCADKQTSFTPTTKRWTIGRDNYER